MTALTKAALYKLLKDARKHGHYSDGLKLWNKCPICGERVECQDYVYKPDGAGRRTTLQTLDAGMSDHIQNYCSECPKCYALRGEHEDGCTSISN
jgi:hypothetical protein